MNGGSGRSNTLRPCLRASCQRVFRRTDLEERVIQGVSIRVTNPARTVVVCFKYRNKIGIDVAIEALRDCRRKKKATMDDLHRIAKARRMANVMRPYLESRT
jgi:hypothetical protein